MKNKEKTAVIILVLLGVGLLTYKYYYVEKVKETEAPK